MVTEEKENLAKVTLRIPRDLLGKVKQLAAKDRRSANFMLLELVEMGIKASEKPAPAPSSQPATE